MWWLQFPSLSRYFIVAVPVEVLVERRPQPRAVAHDSRYRMGGEIRVNSISGQKSRSENPLCSSHAGRVGVMLKTDIIIFFRRQKTRFRGHASGLPDVAFCKGL